MGLFGKKERTPAPSAAKALSAPATILLTCNAIPSHKKAAYWFEVGLNGKSVGRIEQNGVPASFTATEDQNVLTMELCIREHNGNLTKFPAPKQTLELTDGETVRVTFENRKYTVVRERQG